MKKHIMFVSLPLLGHTNQMIALAQELVCRGYKVSFVISEVAKEWVESTGADLIPWNPRLETSDQEQADQKESLWDKVSREKTNWRGEKMMLERLITSYVPRYQTLEPIFRKYKPDLIVVDRAVIPAMDLAWQTNLPCIIQSQFLGNFVNTSSNFPRFGTSYSINMNRQEKIINKFKPLLLLPQFISVLKKLNKVRSGCCGSQNLPDHFKKNLIIVGTTFGVEIPRPIPPLVKMVGPIFPKTIKPLSPSLKEWLEAGEEGTVVIYIAFGTLASLESRQAKALVEGLTDSKFRVLWSIPKNQQHILPNLPPSFRIESFVPQQAVLSHQAVHLFISHCGMNGINEALYYGKPILGLPFFGDQVYNAARIVDLGVALRLNKENLHSAEVRQKINSLLNNQSYQDKANKMSAILKSTRGRELAAEIVETTIAVGISHLVPELIYGNGNI
ncbi:MAG: glycosyltransferase [Cyanobacteria bacterium J06592_8]